VEQRPEPLGAVQAPGSAPPTEPRASIAAGVILEVGGVLVVIGSLLTWRKVLIPTGAATDRGVDFGATGMVVLAAGILGLVLGPAAGAAKGRAARVAFGVLALAAGAVIVVEAIYSMVTLKSHAAASLASNLVNQLGVRPVQARLIANQRIASGIWKVSLQLGIVVALAGGIIVMVGALVAVGSGSTRAGPPASPTPPSPPPEPETQ
jgi:hypothetical protein